MSIVKMFWNKLTRKDNVTIARKLGVTIGDRCLILSNPYKCFGSEPYLVKLGNHVEITAECNFITHDGAVWVLREKEEYKKADKFGRIVVGDNVFIGIKSTIMPGVTIGNNCIIGAGSLVTKSIPSNEVWAGIPAKRICSLEEYEERAKKSFDYTKGLSAEEKEQAVRKLHPDWF